MAKAKKTIPVDHEHTNRLDAIEAWDFAVDFDVDGDDIMIRPTVRWASDSNAGYAT